jgi:hypothetical protein
MASAKASNEWPEGEEVLGLFGWGIVRNFCPQDTWCVCIRYADGRSTIERKTHVFRPTDPRWQ